MVEKKEFPEEGELVLCTVEKILGTTVFARLEDYGKSGVIVISEVAPGRIRNIRDYVSPGKKIVCKVLRVDTVKSHIDLSLRRVSLRDRREILESYTKERSALAILSRALPKQQLETTIQKIKSSYPSVFAFFQEIRARPQLLQQLGLEKTQAEQITQLIKERIKAKIVSVKAKLRISCPEGVTALKSALAIKEPGIAITYISAPRYLIKAEASSYKEASQKLRAAYEKVSAAIKKVGGEAELLEEI